MLATAIKAKIPIIAIHTNDPLNVLAMIKHYTAEWVVLNPVIKGKLPALTQDAVHLLQDCDPEDLNLPALYSRAIECGAVVLFVNPTEIHHAMFDAGTIQMPNVMLKQFVAEYAPDDVDHYELEAALRGLSMKEMVEVSNLAMAESGAFTAESVLRVRRARTVLSGGLKLVDTKQHYYAEPQALATWLAVDGVLFTANVDRIVRPRGLLFSGDPGTGKTSGAKFLAHSLRLPLYVLDVGGTLQKYVGDSEKNFQAALAQVEALAPCVLLLDEIEKVFDTGDDSGVSRRVLGMLLWWLQEHSAQVLTIMTTNSVGGIPPELIRPGRVDRQIAFKGLYGIPAKEFAKAVANSLTNLAQVSNTDVVHGVIDLCNASAVASTTQAEITQMVVDLVKKSMVEKLKE